MDISELSAFQTQTGQDLRKTGDSPQDIVFLLDEIQSYGRERSKMLSCGLVRSQSIKPWHDLYARSCGYVSY